MVIVAVTFAIWTCAAAGVASAEPDEAAAASRITERQAKRAIRSIAAKDYRPAHITIQFCRRGTRQRVLCRIRARYGTYPANYCTAYYSARQGRYAILVVGPLVESCY